MLNLYIIQDPYKNKPTATDAEITARLQNHVGRGNSGRFTWQGVLSVMADSDFPPDSNYWRRYALGAVGAVMDLLGEDQWEIVKELVFPSATIEFFTWRTICEMLEAVLKSARNGERNNQNLAEIAHAELQRLIQ